MITVTIRDLRTGVEKSSAHRTGDEHVALKRAIERRWGKRAIWWQDSGLGFRFGQVIEYAGEGSYDCLTGRCRVDFS